MRLVEDWKKIVRRAWSIKFAILTLFAALLEVVLPAFTSVVPIGVMAGLAAVSSLLSALTRVLQQQGFHDDPQK